MFFLLLDIESLGPIQVLPLSEPKVLSNSIQKEAIASLCSVSSGGAELLSEEEIFCSVFDLT